MFDSIKKPTALKEHSPMLDSIKKPTALPALAACMALLTATAAVGQTTVDFGGRIQADSVSYNGEAQSSTGGNGGAVYQDGSEIRRFRMYLRGDLSANWQYRVQYDFAPGGSENDLKDGYIRYTGLENQSITLGNFKVFSGMEELTSSNNITFAERSIINALDEARRWGIGYQNWNDRHTFQAAVFTDEPNLDEEGSGFSTRFVYRPSIGGGAVLHLGVNLQQQTTDDNAHRVRARGENHLDAQRIIDTGTLRDLDSFMKTGLEFAYLNGRFAFNSEFSQQTVTRTTNPDATFSGFYAEASYFLTDDARRYSNGSAAFSSVRPSSSDTGAWQIGVRIGSLNLTDTNAGVTGGEANTLSLAVNWYRTNNLRFLLNYVVAEADEVAKGKFSDYKDDPTSWILRIRYTF